MVAAYAWIIALTVFAIAVRFGDDGLRTLFAWRGDGSSALAARVTIASSAGFALACGLLCAVVATEVRGGALGLLLPDFPRRFRNGVAMMSAIVACIVGLLVAAPANAEVALLAGALSFGWFALGAALPLVARARLIAAVLLVSVSALVYRPALYADWVRDHRVVGVLLSSAFAVALMSRASSVSALRDGLARIGAGPRWYADTPGTLDAWPPVIPSSATRPITSVWEWTQAATREFAPFRFALGRSWLRATALQAVYLAFFAYLVGSSQMGLIGLSLSRFGLQLSADLYYPLSRRQRALVRFGCALIESVSFFALFAVSLLVLSTLPLPHGFLEVSEPARRAPLALLVLSAFAFAPIAQMARPVHQAPRAPTSLSASVGLKWMGLGLTYVLLIILPAQWLWRRPASTGNTAFAILAMAAVLMQALHFVALQLIYRRASLVPSASRM
jgi:hypothetical protein